MILADFVLDLKLNKSLEIARSYDLSMCVEVDYMPYKRKQIREYYQSKFEIVYTIEIGVGIKEYILGFDSNLFYFYLFNLKTENVDLFFTKDDIQDSSFACLFDSIFRKEVYV